MCYRVHMSESSDTANDAFKQKLSSRTPLGGKDVNAHVRRQSRASASTFVPLFSRGRRSASMIIVK